MSVRGYSGMGRRDEEKRGDEGIMAQSGNTGGALPVTVRDGTDAALARRATPIMAGQLGVQARFINKHQLADIPIRLLLAPKPPGGLDLRPILLGGAHRFFYSSGPIAPVGATKR